MEGFDLTGLSLEELDELNDAIKNRKAEARKEEKAERDAEKARHAEEMKSLVQEGNTVRFLYGRENTEHEGIVIRASDATVTIRADVFAENHKDGKDTNYVRYDRIVDVLGTAAEATEETQVAM